MKKGTKILTLVIAICMLLASVAVIASAFTDVAEISYENQLKPDGATNTIVDYNCKPITAEDYIGSTKWTADSYFYNQFQAVEATAKNGNKYYNLKYTQSKGQSHSSKPGTASFVLSSANTVTDYGLVFNSNVQNAYATIDFDFCATGYTVTAEDGSYKTYTPEELAAAGLSPEDEGVDLSLANGSTLGTAFKFWVDSPADKNTEADATAASLASPTISKDETTGKWYYYYSDSQKLEMSNEPGKFDHVTFVINTRASSGKYAAFVTCYINGEFLYQKSVFAYRSGATSVSLYALNVAVPNTYVAHDSYSYGIDNLAVNYYGANYSSGDAHGVDDAAATKNPSMNLDTQINMVYNKDYISPNGHIQVVNSETDVHDIVSLDYLVSEELKTIKTGGTLVVARDLKDLDVPEGNDGFKIECDTDVYTVTLSQSAKDRNFFLVKTDYGYEVMLNPAILEWYDTNGNLVVTTYQAEGTAAKAPKTPEELGYETISNSWYTEGYFWEKTDADDMTVTEGTNVFKVVYKNFAKIDGVKANMNFTDGMIFNLYLPLPDEDITNITATNAISYGESFVKGLDEDRYLISVTLPLDSFKPVTTTLSFEADGQAFSLDFKADALKYSKSVAESYDCGSEETLLVAKLVEYKRAACNYLETVLTEAENEALDAFDTIYQSHTNCKCNEAFSEAMISNAERNVDYKTTLADKIKEISFILNPTDCGLLIEMAEGAGDFEVTSVTYSYKSGNFKESDSLEIEDRGNAYLAKGLPARHFISILTITVSNGSKTVSGTYSLGAYIINNPEVEIAKSLYQYSTATRNYKFITDSETQRTVTFDTNGGSLISNASVKKNAAVERPADPVNVGYKLVGWTLNGEDYDFSTPVTSDITLVAKWERITDEAEIANIYTGMQSVLLMGQSNMVGVGDMLDVEPIEDENLKVFRGDRWWKMTEPLHTNSGASGIGLGASFGKAFVDHFNCQLGLIPAAKGSTTIDQWAVGGTLYNEAVRLAKAAKETSNICAILWHQGESSQSDKEYAEKLHVILDSLIEEVGLDANNLVIITGELSEAKTARDEFAERLAKLGEEYKRYGIADADGLTLKDDNLHFDAKSQRLFGYRYFEQFYKIVADKDFEYVNDPDYYYAPQQAADMNIYMPFDDMCLGTFGTLYAQTITGNGRLLLNMGSSATTDNIVEVCEEEEGGLNRYIVVHNNSDRNYIRIQPNTDAGRSLVIEADVKLVKGVSSGIASLFYLIGNTDTSTSVTTSTLVVENGSVYNKQGEDAICDLSEDVWVNIKIELDFKNNKKLIYIDGTLVEEEFTISSKDLSSYAVTTIRLISNSNTASGSIALDNFKCYYLDSVE